ncbi:MAG: hypothetical protein LUF26_06980, partial [Firmicutes bacterium]|nr:hypothetical protein [Bacillota bacterium]
VDILHRFFKLYTDNEPTTEFEYEQMYEDFINACEYMYILQDYVGDLEEQLGHTSAKMKALIKQITHKIDNNEE